MNDEQEKVWKEAEIELDYNVMAHAQKTISMYGWNGRVHILYSRHDRQIFQFAAGSWFLQWSGS
jgi:hypothetical protein